VVGVGLVLLGATVVVAWPDVLAFLHGARTENREGLYVLRQDLAPGMPVAEVEEVVQHCSVPFKRTWVSTERLVVSTPVGFMKYTTLQLDFSDGRLAHARVRDDEGRVMPDAPKDF